MNKILYLELFRKAKFSVLIHWNPIALISNHFVDFHLIKECFLDWSQLKSFLLITVNFPKLKRNKVRLGRMQFFQTQKFTFFNALAKDSASVNLVFKLSILAFFWESFNCTLFATSNTLLSSWFLCSASTCFNKFISFSYT